jgi:hypothetical protein
LLLLATGKGKGASHNDNRKSLHGSVRLRRCGLIRNCSLPDR